MVFIQVFIRKNKFNTASNWSLYRSGHAHLAIKKKKMAEARKEYMSETASQPPLNSIELNRLYFSNWCMVTESFMTWVFWYLSYIMSSYKHWNVECVWDNHTSYSRIESHIAVLNLGVASGQYSCPRLHTTVLGHNTGLISKHPFNNTIIQHRKRRQ